MLLVLDAMFLKLKPGFVSAGSGCQRPLKHGLPACEHLYNPLFVHTCPACFSITSSIMYAQLGDRRDGLLLFAAHAGWRGGCGGADPGGRHAGRGRPRRPDQVSCFQLPLLPRHSSSLRSRITTEATATCVHQAEQGRGRGRRPMSGNRTGIPCTEGRRSFCQSLQQLDFLSTLKMQLVVLSCAFASYEYGTL